MTVGADDRWSGAAGRALVAERWAVVGGGMLGLSLADRLNRLGHDVSVFEGGAELGGLASAWRIGDTTWDRHYHVTLYSDGCLRGLLADLGLDDDMHWVETKTGFYTGGRLISMSNALEFLRFPPLGLVSKGRLALTILRASRIKDWQALERIPVADWLLRWSGRATFETIWLPLLRAKLGDNYKRTSAAFIWATIARMYAARRSGLKREMFGYLPGGYARVLSCYAEALGRRGVRLTTDARVESVTHDGGETTLGFAQGRSEAFDRVVLTVPAPIAAQLCPQLTVDERQRFGDVVYQGIVCASVLLKRPLSPYYVTNITDPGLPFTAVIEMSALVDRLELGGRALVYLPRYATQDDPVFERTDAEIEASFLAGLRRMHATLSSEDVLAFRVSRVRHVHALSTLDYSRRLPPMRTSVPGVYVVNSAHIVNGTLNVNETVALADRALPVLLGRDRTRTAAAAA